MSGFWGEKLKIAVFGESHGAAIGVVIDGLPAGLRLDEAHIAAEMARRAPGGALSTPRKEADRVEIVSGFFEGRTTGTPLCGMIRNGDTRSGDYGDIRFLPRPGHGDYGWFVKTGGANDFRGGGHGSGRLTAPLVFCGAICKQILQARNIEIYAHLLSVGGVSERRFQAADFGAKIPSDFPALEPERGAMMREEIARAQKDGDSVGGVVECAVCGVPAGTGEPFFRSVESVLSALLFSVPAVKGVEFGDGFALSAMRGSDANDAYEARDGAIGTLTNRNGGVTGGIANGMPIVFRAALKPTPSVFRSQPTVDLRTGENAALTIKGRHDPCVAVRAVPVIEAVAAIGICDLIL